MCNSGHGVTTRTLKADITSGCLSPGCPDMRDAQGAESPHDDNSVFQMGTWTAVAGPGPCVSNRSVHVPCSMCMPCPSPLGQGGLLVHGKG